MASGIKVSVVRKYEDRLSDEEQIDADSQADEDELHKDYQLMAHVDYKFKKVFKDRFRNNRVHLLKKLDSVSRGCSDDQREISKYLKRVTHEVQGLLVSGAFLSINSLDELPNIMYESEVLDFDMFLETHKWVMGNDKNRIERIRKLN